VSGPKRRKGGRVTPTSAEREAAQRGARRFVDTMRPEDVADLQARPEVYDELADQLIGAMGVEAFTELAQRMADADDDELAALRAEWARWWAWVEAGCPDLATEEGRRYRYGP
jgi:hypothetical protein